MLRKKYLDNTINVLSVLTTDHSNLHLQHFMTRINYSLSFSSWKRDIKNFDLILKTFVPLQSECDDVYTAFLSPS